MSVFAGPVAMEAPFQWNVRYVFLVRERVIIGPGPARILCPGKLARRFGESCRGFARCLVGSNGPKAALWRMSRARYARRIPWSKRPSLFGPSI